MIEYNPDIQLNLRKKDVEKYVIGHGWHPVEHPNKHFQVFDGVLNNDGKPIRLALPIDEQPPDTALRIYQAIQTIAGVEDRSIAEVVADIKQIEARSGIVLEVETVSSNP
jgi:hypothetical protein